MAGFKKTPRWRKREKWHESLPQGYEQRPVPMPNPPSIYASVKAKYEYSKLPTPATYRIWAPMQAESGAWVPYVIEPMAESILAWALDRAQEPGSPIAFLAEAQFQPLLDRWARAEARRMRYEGHIAESGGEFDAEGNPHKLMDQLVVWEKRSTYHAERAGLDPLALAKIRRELAELHKEEDAVHALSELQQKYARRPKPQVIDGQIDGQARGAV